MKTTFSIRLIASDHLFYDGPCTGVIIPALDGQREVLAHHESVIMAIDCGELKIKMPDGTWQIAIVGSGFARVSHGRVYVLVDTAERPEEIDVKRAQEAKERAEEQLRQKQSIQEYHISSASLARAMSRLSASGKSGDVVKLNFTTSLFCTLPCPFLSFTTSPINIHPRKLVRLILLVRHTDSYLRGYPGTISRASDIGVRFRYR